MIQHFISMLAVCGAIVAIFMVLWHGVKVLRSFPKKIPLLYYFLGPALLSKWFLGPENNKQLVKMWRWCFVLIVCLLVIELFYPFPSPKPE